MVKSVNGKISIHAPSRERLGSVCQSCAFLAFQSTLPRGSDLAQSYRHSRYINFNPRSLAGATCSNTRLKRAANISIHAPSRERRRLAALAELPAAISIHAPSRERPSVRGYHLIFIKISIHAPSRERLLVVWLNLSMAKFQSTLPRGSDSGQSANPAPS